MWNIPRGVPDGLVVSLLTAKWWISGERDTEARFSCARFVTQKAPTTIACVCPTRGESTRVENLETLLAKHRTVAGRRGGCLLCDDSGSELRKGGSWRHSRKRYNDGWRENETHSITNKSDGSRSTVT